MARPWPRLWPPFQVRLACVPHSAVSLRNRAHELCKRLKRAGRLAEERRPGPSGKPLPLISPPGGCRRRTASLPAQPLGICWTKCVAAALAASSAFVGLNALQLLSQPPRLHQASAIFFRDILSDVIWPKSGQNVKMSRKNVTKTQVRPHGREVGELCQGWRGDEPRV